MTDEVGIRTFGATWPTVRISNVQTENMEGRA